MDTGWVAVREDAVHRTLTVVWRLGARGEMATSEIRELWHGLFKTDTENDGGGVDDRSL